MEGIRDKSVIVTGTGTPVGGAVAKLLAAEGAKVAAVCGSEPAAVRVHEAIAEAGGVSFAFGGDVEDLATTQRLIQDTVDSFGRVDSVVHIRVGREGKAPLLGDTEREEWERHVRVYLGGTFTLLQEVLPLFLEQGGGDIVVSSTAAPKTVVHATTSAATRAFVSKVALDYADQGIRANTISLGPIDRGAAAPPAGLPAVGVVEAAAPDPTPTATLSTPDEVADVFAFLLSSASGPVNGANIVVDKGWPLRQ